MVETERKFLIGDIKKIPRYIRKSEILQAYISTLPEVRIRKLDDKYYRTEKSEGDIVRNEKEEEISKEEFYRLLPKAVGSVIRKKRLYIELPQKLIAEVDIYEGSLSPLLTVEVEFSSIEEAMLFVPPTWFGKEVTENKEYKNRSLAQNGLPN